MEKENLKRTPFTIIENAFIEDTSLTIYEKIIFIILCKFAGDKNHCWPSKETIVTYADCSARKVYDGVRGLIEKGFISIKKTRNPNPHFSLIN